MLTSNGHEDIFIMKFDSEGNFKWAKSMGNGDSGFNDIGLSLTTDISDNVYVTGFFGGTVDFDPEEETQNLVSNGGTDIFMLKLDSNGNFVWAKSIGGIGHDIGHSMIADNSGHIYLTGYF